MRGSPTGNKPRRSRPPKKEKLEGEKGQGRGPGGASSALTGGWKEVATITFQRSLRDHHRLVSGKADPHLTGGGARPISERPGVANKSARAMEPAGNTVRTSLVTRKKSRVLSEKLGNYPGYGVGRKRLSGLWGRSAPKRTTAAQEKSLIAEKGAKKKEGTVTPLRGTTGEKTADLRKM